MSDSLPMSELRELVRRHKVCYEVWPESIMRDGTRVPVGYQIELCGVSDHAHDETTPGCEQCVATFRNLQEIVAALLPVGGRECDWVTEPFDASWHEAAAREFRPEIVLALRLVHRHGAERPVDVEQRGCLAELEKRLEELGIARGAFRKPRG